MRRRFISVLSIAVLLIAVNASAGRRHAASPSPGQQVLQGVIVTLTSDGATIRARGGDRDVRLTASTAVTVDGQPTGAGALNVGDKAEVQGHEEGDHKLVADAIKIETGYDSTGVVKSVSSTSLTIDTSGGSQTFTLTSDTVVLLHGKHATAADLAVGMKVDVVSVAVAGGTRKALLVEVKTEFVETEGVVTAVSPTSITVHSSNGTDTTSAINADTKLRREGDTITIADIKVGSHVTVKSVKGADGKLTAAVIELHDDNHLVEVQGTIAAVGTDSITIHPHSGADVTVAVNADTIIRKGDKRITLADLKVGDQVYVEAQPGDKGALKAVRICVKTEDVRYVEIEGTLTAVTGSLLTVKTGDGKSVNVSITSKTIIRLDDAKGSVTDLKVGAAVEINAKRNADGSLEALYVNVEDQSGDNNDDHNHDGEFTGVSGTIATVGASSIVVTTKSGDVTIATDSSTVVLKGGKPATLADLKSGQHVEVKAKVNADKTLLAKYINIDEGGGEQTEYAYVSGTVGTVGTTSIVVTTKSGDVTVATDSSTVVLKDGKPATLADLKSGQRVEVKAKVNADKSLLAKYILIYSGDSHHD